MHLQNSHPPAHTYQARILNWTIQHSHLSPPYLLQSTSLTQIHQPITKRSCVVSAFILDEVHHFQRKMSTYLLRFFFASSYFDGMQTFRSFVSAPYLRIQFNEIKLMNERISIRTDSWLILLDLPIEIRARSCIYLSNVVLHLHV